MKHTELQLLIISAVDKIIQKEQFVKNILQDVVQAGGVLLLVGGSVRDIIVGNQIKDLDFEIYKLDAGVVQSLLQKYGRVDVVGKSFGVFKLHGLHADFALPRTDGSGRKPVVHTDPFLEYRQAFVRRDLTMNAMGINLQTYELIDVFGGVQDVHNKIFRAPDVSFFVQDPLRLFRVMQFVGRFQMAVDQTLHEACKNMNLDGIAQERVYQEFYKLFTQSKKPSMGLRWLHDLDRWNQFLPECTDVDSLCRAVDRVVDEQDIHKREILCWTIVFLYTHFFVKKDFTTLKKIIFNFILNQKITDAVILLLQNYVRALEVRGDFEIKMLAWHVQPYCVQDIVQILQVTGCDNHAHILKQLAEKNTVLDQVIAPLLDGKDILDFAQGKQVGEILRAAYDMQISLEISDKQELLSRVRALQK